MRAPAAAVALVAAVGGALLAPSVPLAEEPPAPPTAVLEADATTVEAGKALKLDSSKSTAGATPIVGHVWDLDGDGSFETDTGVEPTAEVKPSAPGPLTVQVRVVDEGGKNSDAKLELDVTPPPPPPPPKAVDGSAVTVPQDENGSNRDSTERAEPGRPDAAGEPADPTRPAPEAQPPTAAPEAAPAPEPAEPAKALTPIRMSAAPALVPRRVLARASAQGETRPVADVRAAASTSVSIKDFKYAPASVSVSVGDSITWTNQDVAPHTATASDGSFDTGNLDKGQSGSITFDKAGSFPYICSIHPSMKATVTVADGGGSGGGGGDDTGSGAAADDTSDDSSGGLPQTGLNLLAVVLLAGLMTGSGTLLRRRVR